MSSNKRKRWVKNRIRIQLRLEDINRTLRFEDAWDKIFKVGRYKE